MTKFIFHVVILGALGWGCGSRETPHLQPDTGLDMDAPEAPDTTGDFSDTGYDPVFSCTPGQLRCWGNVYYRCGDDGVTRLDEIVCEDVCTDELGCVLCRPQSRTCETNVSMICAPDGMSWITGRDCDEWGSMCGADGFCADPCGEAESTSSYVGCEYWPVPLANTEELSTRFDFRVVAANPGDAEAHVSVTLDGAAVFTGTVPASGLLEIPLGWIEGQSFGIPEGSWSSISMAGGAYRLTSDRPVTVSQFNPFEYAVSGGGGGGGGGGTTVYSYTNDATLLLPSHVLTGDYVGLTYVPFSRAVATTTPVTTPAVYGKYPGYIAIVGVTPEPTSVRVHVSGHVAAESGGLFSATARGGVLEFTLSRGQVVHVAADVPPDCTASRPGYHSEEICDSGVCSRFDTCREVDFDLTGTRITADRPVAVFGGHVCAYVPYTAQACDHLEVQIAPIQTWGTGYVSMPMVDAGSSAPNLVRVVSAFDGTTINIDPPQDGHSTETLLADQFAEFLASTPFSVTGSHSIMVGQFLLGQYLDPENPAARGDPAMTVLVPAEQYRQDYTFIMPTSYNATTNGQNYLMIVRPPGLALSIDSTPVAAAWQSVGGQEIAIVPLDGGTHGIAGAGQFGIISYGLGEFTSYAYPAGLNLEQITTII